MVAGLLFLALAFFAVGQAGATRNGAQSGADAAALAAAMESRDDFWGDLEGRLLDFDFLEDLLDGGPLGEPGGGCAAAGRLAQANRTTLSGDGCRWLGGGRWGFKVTVDSEPLGDTVLPDTAGKRATASAVAVVEFLCTFEPPEGEPPADESPAPSPLPTPPPDKPAPTAGLTCQDGDFELDPEKPDLLPDMSDLFSVRLAED